jgi:hypothetical protein
MTGAHRTRRAGTHRRHTVAGAAAALAVLLSGCGIRATSVPTEYEAAPPSRASCAPVGDGVGTQAGGAVPVQIYLVCASQLAAVQRTVRIDDDAATDRRKVARALLDALQAPPPTAEKEAGYTSDVRGGITVGSPRAGDPEGALRLSTPPRELTAFTLAQIVCTLANSAAAGDDRSVVLGGLDSDALQSYRCTPEVLSRPATTAPPATEVRPAG